MPLSNTEYDVLPGDFLFVVTGQVDLTGPVNDGRTLTIVHGFDAILRRLGGGGQR